MKFPTDTDTGEYLDIFAARNAARVNGATGRPNPPRNIQQQAGARKVLVTWDAPQVVGDIVGWKIYTGNENSLLDTLYDPNLRQYNVPATAGVSPPKINIFVSSFSKNGESRKVQIMGAASVEAGAPSDPKPLRDSAASGNTGPTLGIDGAAFGDGGGISFR